MTTTKKATKKAAPRKKSLPTSEKIRTALKHKPYRMLQTRRLDTGNVGLNAVFGDHKTGIRVPSIIELSGQPSSGKSVIATDIGAVAQADGFIVGLLDFEQSFDEKWSTTRGLKCGPDEEQFSLFQPYLGTVGTEKEPHLITGEELLKEAEHWMKAVRVVDRHPFLILDSVASIMPEGAAEDEIDDQNMRNDQALPKLMSRLMPRWIGIVASCGGVVIFINQLRQKPGIAFGDPWYSNGGNALPFYAHVRVRMRRRGKDSGKMRLGSDIIGIKGLMKNHKNKAGGVEGREIGYKIFNDGRAQFVKADRI